MEIKFNKKLYTKEAIQAAVKAYDGLADFDLEEDANYFIVNLDKIDKEVELNIRDEFCNYVLSNVKIKNGD